MTYGWAILIIAVVLAVLFQLGVFSGGNLTPGATAGSCQVQKTAAGSSLAGECQGQLPEYVGQFNGQNGYVSATQSIPAKSSLTVTAWIYLTSVPGNNAGIVGLKPAGTCGAISIFPNGNCHIQVCLDTDAGNGYANDGTVCIAANTWYFVVGITNQTQHQFGLYINGASQFTTAPFTGNTIAATQIYIGQFPAQGAFFPGNLANIQVYNTTLSSSEILALYQEGIGGAPIRPQNLVAWYPLNGNENDYSGNNNNGQISGASFSSSWQSSYKAP